MYTLLATQSHNNVLIHAVSNGCRLENRAEATNQAVGDVPGLCCICLSLVEGLIVMLGYVLPGIVTLCFGIEHVLVLN